MIDEITKDAIRIMRQGGTQVCDHAIDKWWSGAYHGTPEDIKENVDKFKAIKSRVSELSKWLRDSDELLPKLGEQ